MVPADRTFSGRVIVPMPIPCRAFPRPPVVSPPSSWARPVSVVVSLAPADSGGLTRAAQDPGTSREDRAARLRALTPRPAAREAARRWLRAHGFTVTESGDWTLTATAPASVAAGALKTPVVRHPDGVAAAGDLDVPADLRDTVASVRGLDTRPILRHHAAPSGLFGSAELRTAYRAPAIGSGAGTTVATVQFSGWSPD